tara:strand:+ start:1191 stop:1319 length:129 start_codon:yes stop_codon:yes gene_type:complete
MKKVIISLLYFALITLTGSCGKKGDPQVPNDQIDTYSRKYPK